MILPHTGQIHLPPGDVRRTNASAIVLHPIIFPIATRQNKSSIDLANCRLPIKDALCPPHSMGPTAKHCGFAMTAPMPPLASGFGLWRKNFFGSQESRVTPLEAALGRARRVGKIRRAGPSSEADTNRFLSLTGILPKSLLARQFPLRLGKFLYVSPVRRSSAERPPRWGDSAFFFPVGESIC